VEVEGKEGNGNMKVKKKANEMKGGGGGSSFVDL
jgi:hypothetical protein